MQKNRILNINVEFNVTDTADGGFGGGATYTHRSSMPDMSSALDPDGSIHLDRVNDFDTSEYNENVDLAFFLQTPCSGAHSFDVEWATKYAQGMTVDVPEGGKATEMDVAFDPGQPQVIVIKDKDDDSNTYHYKPAIELVRPGKDRYKIGLDPQIVNRPRN